MDGDNRKRRRHSDKDDDGTGTASVPMPGLMSPPTARKRRPNHRGGPALPQTPPRTPSRSSTPQLGAASAPDTPVSLPRAKGTRLFVWKANQTSDPPTEYTGLGSRRNSLMFNPPWLRGDGVERNPDAYLEQQILPEERQSWLRSHVNWINGLGNGWVGKKILGLGQYGLAGLWELPDTPENKGRKLRQVVVKQAGGSKHAVDLLQAEARFLMLFRQTGTKHVVKMYRRFYTEKGQGAIPSTDPGGGEVGRIFLEYCQGGDFAGLLRAMNKKYTAQDPLPEELIWHIFKCLALALTVIENGNEALDGDSWDRELVHFDIKPANVFIGGYDNEHQKTPIFKIADFGLAEEIPAVQSNAFLGARRQHGTPAFWAPEQYDESNRRGNTRRYGTATNVWQIGKVLYNLICRGRTFDSNAELFRIVVGNKKPRTMGHHILEAPYSVTLRKTILTCLAFSPPTRPTPRSLVRLVDQGIVACDTVAEGLGPIGDANIWMTGYQEPTELSAAWYSDPEPRVDEDDVETG